MSRDDELTFADHAGRLYARRYGFPPMVGRLIGYLLICAPRQHTIGELAEALLASRSAVTGAVQALEGIHFLRRTRAAGERMDRVGIDLQSPQATGFDVTEYVELGELARDGLDLLHDAPPERRAALQEMAEFADFLVERIPQWEQEWKAHRARLVEDGRLRSHAEHRQGGRQS